VAPPLNPVARQRPRARGQRKPAPPRDVHVPTCPAASRARAGSYASRRFPGAGVLQTHKTPPYTEWRLENPRSRWALHGSLRNPIRLADLATRARCLRRAVEIMSRQAPGMSRRPIALAHALTRGGGAIQTPARGPTKNTLSAITFPHQPGTGRGQEKSPPRSVRLDRLRCWASLSPEKKQKTRARRRASLALNARRSDRP